MSWRRKTFGFREVKSSRFYVDTVSEGMVTCGLMIPTVFSLTTLNRDLYTPNTPAIGLLAGFVIYLLAESFGPISGGFMNPAITFSHMLAGRMSFIRGKANDLKKVKQQRVTQGNIKHLIMLSYGLIIQ